MNDTAGGGQLNAYVVNGDGIVLATTTVADRGSKPSDIAATLRKHANLIRDFGEMPPSSADAAGKLLEDAAQTLDGEEED